MANISSPVTIAPFSRLLAALGWRQTRSVEYQIRTTLILMVAVLTMTAWCVTYYQGRNMGLLMQVGVPMSLGMEGGATLASFTLFTGMWLVMMVAMMLPSTYPILLLHRTVSHNRSAGGFGSTFAFALSYFLTWAAAGVLFFYAYVWIGRLRASVPQADALVLRSAGLALVASGWYQFSPSKLVCLRHCQNPLQFVMQHWKDGRIGAARMGVVHGLYCFGCCWGLMTILFVMGVMHLGWMAAIGAIILLEKILPRRQWITKGVGAVFIALGGVVLMRPGILLRLSSQIMIR